MASQYPEQSADYGALQSVIDDLFESREEEAQITGEEVDEEGVQVRRLDVVLAAQAADLPEDLQKVVSLLPPGNYSRQRLCIQLNSAITGHGWGMKYGTVI